VHFGTGVVKRGDAQKIVFMGLIVVTVFNVTGMFQIAVGQENGLGFSGGAGCEV
jgi:hypothetical protein